MTKSATLTVNAAQAVGAALKAVPASEPQYVMIYQVPAGQSGAPPNGGAACSGNCSKFAWDPVTQQFKTGSGQDQGAGWPVSAQRNNCDTGDQTQFDSVGVYVKVNHPFAVIQNLVPGIGNSVTLDPYSVFRLEPTSSSACWCSVARVSVSCRSGGLTPSAVSCSSGSRS